METSSEIDSLISHAERLFEELCSPDVPDTETCLKFSVDGEIPGTGIPLRDVGIYVYRRDRVRDFVTKHPLSEKDYPRIRRCANLTTSQAKLVGEQKFWKALCEEVRLLITIKSDGHVA